MSWNEAFLGVIALATLIMALIQVGAVIAAARIAKQAQQTLTTVQRDIRPLIAKVHAVADEASRTASLATAQAPSPSATSPVTIASAASIGHVGRGGRSSARGGSASTTRCGPAVASSGGATRAIASSISTSDARGGAGGDGGGGGAGAPRSANSS